MKATVQTEQRPGTSARPAQEYVSPEVNIFETKDGYVLEAEMPGVNKEGLEITLEGNEITIVGHRKSEAVPGEPLFRERPWRITAGCSSSIRPSTPPRSPRRWSKGS